jgi:hypothetical protein
MYSTFTFIYSYIPSYPRCHSSVLLEKQNAPKGSRSRGSSLSFRDTHFLFSRWKHTIKGSRSNGIGNGNGNGNAEGKN